MDPLLNDIAEADLDRLAEQLHIMKMREGIDIVALPIDDYNILVRRLAELYKRHTYVTDMPPVEGTFIWKGITFTSWLRHNHQDPIDGEEITDTSNWFQEDWDPEWNARSY